MYTLKRILLKRAPVLLLAVACAPAATETRQEILAITTGKVAGRVVDEETGLPLSAVSASAQYLGDDTDKQGRYDIVYLDPGPVRVAFHRRDISPEFVTVEVVAGQTTVLDVAVEKAPPACCELDGRWLIEMTLRQTTESGEAAEKRLSGIITFSKSIPRPFQEWRVESLDETVDEFGTFEIDFADFFGDKYSSDFVRTTFCDGSEDCIGLREAWGYVSNRDQVEITLIPRVSDSGFGLNGVVSGNQVRGEWIERAFAVTTRGDFVMERLLN